MPIIKFDIRGNRPAFVADLRLNTPDGPIVQTQNLPVSGSTQFNGVANGNYYIVVIDNNDNIAEAPVNVSI